MDDFKEEDLVIYVGPNLLFFVYLHTFVDRKFRNALVDCACCHPGVPTWVTFDDLRLAKPVVFSELLNNPNEMFKFLKREIDKSQLDTSN